MKFIVFIILIVFVLSCPSDCVDCDPSASICFACSEGFQLNVLGTCIDSNTIPFCNLYGPTNQCFSCRVTYTLQNYGKCLKDYSACLMYDPSDVTKCIQCGFGTVLSNNVCTGVINCKSNTSATCGSCLPGFQLLNGKCVDNTGNCKIIEANGVCNKCNEGFNLVGYTCIPSNVTVYGCYIYDSQGFCHLCKQGFFLYQGNCFLPSQILLLQLGLVQLSTVLSQRNPISTTKTVPTAEESSSNNFDGFGSGSSFGSFAFENSKDHHLIQNCFNYNDFSGACTSCIQGYYLSSNQCNQVSAFCNTYDEKTGLCLTCKYGITLFSSQCTDPNCLNQRLNGCLLCKHRFRLDYNNFCILNDLNCLRVQSNRCAQCTQGYYVSPSKTCEHLPDGCSAVTPGTASCSHCSVEFQLSNGLCRRVDPVVTVTKTSIAIPFCASQVGRSCNQCVLGYQLSNNQCILITLPANCQKGDTSFSSTITKSSPSTSGSQSTNGGAIIISSASLPLLLQQKGMKKNTNE